MVNMPGTESAVGLAKQYPKLGVGLHFCITEGTPLTEARTLKSDNGHFLSRGELVKRIALGEVSKNDIAHEFEAQLEKMIQFGLNPTHSDSHQHVMMIPFIFDAILPILDRYQLNIRVVNPPANFLNLLFSRPKKFIKQALNSYLAGRMLRKYPGKTNRWLVSIHELDIQTSALDEKSYDQLLARADANQVVELMVHPYIQDPVFETMYPDNFDQKKTFIEKCIQEHAILSKAPLFNDYELCTFSELR